MNEEEAAMAVWSFQCIDNGGKRQFFDVKANSKPEAIDKGIQKARKNSKGDINNWECSLKRA